VFSPHVGPLLFRYLHWTRERYRFMCRTYDWLRYIQVHR
jgi:hypothetical protein